MGKWHLGHQREHRPTRHGFDHWFGLPYSNDMWRFHPESPGAWAPLPLMLGDTVLDLDPDQTTLTRSVTERAVEFAWMKRRDAEVIEQIVTTREVVELAAVDQKHDRGGLVASANRAAHRAPARRPSAARSRRSVFGS